MSIARVSSFAACLLVSAAASAPALAQATADYTVTDVEESFSCEAVYDAPTMKDGTCGAPYVNSRPWFRDDEKPRPGLVMGTKTTGGQLAKRVRTPERSAVDPAVELLPQLPGERDLLIEFANASAELTERAQANARVFATALKGPALKNVRFAIDGHTNSVGSEIYNKELSERRAKALVTFLEAQGIDGTRFEIEGYGETRPRDTENTESSENRRVEARRLDGPSVASTAR
jgi:outer membrane protein OmpA-like peptidoglycan-associated protein